MKTNEVQVEKIVFNVLTISMKDIQKTLKLSQQESDSMVGFTIESPGTMTLLVSLVGKQLIPIINFLKTITTNDGNKIQLFKKEQSNIWFIQ